jgi:glucan phosphoethanolaminetransferase (alkaline phosphatase superfamily)
MKGKMMKIKMFLFFIFSVLVSENAQAQLILTDVENAFSAAIIEIAAVAVSILTVLSGIFAIRKLIKILNCS